MVESLLQFVGNPFLLSCFHEQNSLSLVLGLILGQAHFGSLLRVKVSQVGRPGVLHCCQYLRPKECDSEPHRTAMVWNAGKSPLNLRCLQDLVTLVRYLPILASVIACWPPHGGGWWKQELKS